MKYSHRFPAAAVLCVCFVALTVTGCWKNTLAIEDDLQFSATSTVQTKAIYGADAGNIQRIVWQGGDEVRIASDLAETLIGRHACDYIVTPEEGDEDAASAQSRGRISRKPTSFGSTEDSGLRWPENATGSASFWSVYPATAMDEDHPDEISATISSTTTLSLSSRQPSGSVVKILDPVNGSYPMVACMPSVAANSSLVKLIYYPAFTAFQITLVNDTQVQLTINSCSLTSITSFLSGKFTAPIEDLASRAPATSSVSITNVGKTVSAVVGQVLAAGEGVTFNIFCLPQNITDLTFECNYTDDTGTNTKRLALSTSGGTPLTFSACKQHRLNLNFNAAGQVDFEMTDVIAVVVENAFPEKYDVDTDDTGAFVIVDKETGETITPEELQQAILDVRHVVITEDHGIEEVNYVNGMYAFVNLETLTIDNASSINSVSVEGLPQFKTLDIVQADAIQDVSILDCPLTESVSINSQSLKTVTLENLSVLKTITVQEGTANSNLEEFTMTGCPDLEEAHFGATGSLRSLDLSNSQKLKTLDIGLAYQLRDVDLTNCSALESIYINECQTLPYLDLEDCTSLKSLVLVNPQNLLAFEMNSSTLETIRFIGQQGSQNLGTLSLNTPALTTAEFTNNQSLTNLTLSNLPSSITDLTNFLPYVGGNGSRKLDYLSLTNCNGFRNITLDPAQDLSYMHFDSCSNLRTVSLRDCGACNVWGWPSPTTTLVATKHNCPRLSNTYSVNNYGTGATYNFTNN
ncbi:MAG: hypothetical protein K6E35_02540 [Bacteroidales bacterium]|nr:hypothetical protein [Bacteroidales bacterium]